MISMFKIIGDQIGAYAVHIAGGVGAVVLASSAYEALVAAATPITHALV